MRAVRAIIAKELAEVLRNRILVLTSILPGIVFLIVPIIIAVSSNRVNARSQSAPQAVAEMMIRTDPGLKDLPERVVGQIYLFRQFVIFLLIVPEMTALTIAVYSIIGEKQTRSLEPLLATPISSMELLLAKSLGAALPAVLFSWALFGLYVITIHFVALPQVLPHVLTAITFGLIGIIGPLVAILGLSLGVIVSSRANDPRTAQQIGGLIVLPIIGLFTGQLQGFFLLTFPALLLGAIVLLVTDIIILGIGVGLFDRETILVRWK